MGGDVPFHKISFKEKVKGIFLVLFLFLVFFCLFVRFFFFLIRKRKVKIQRFHKTHYCCYTLVCHFLNREYKMFSLCQNSNKSCSNSLHTSETLIRGA
jgi:CBS domain containing-hemolysin-like protein